MGTPIEEISRAADGVAEVLGLALAAHDRGEILPGSKIEQARNVLFMWHRIKYAELERERSRVPR